jgi:hypothetical protein
MSAQLCMCRSAFASKLCECFIVIFSVVCLSVEDRGTCQLVFNLQGGAIGQLLVAVGCRRSYVGADLDSSTAVLL